MGLLVTWKMAYSYLYPHTDDSGLEIEDNALDADVPEFRLKRNDGAVAECRI